MDCNSKLELTDQDHEDLILRCGLMAGHLGSHYAVVYWPQEWKKNGTSYKARHAAPPTSEG